MSISIPIPIAISKKGNPDQVRRTALVRLTPHQAGEPRR
jgi:hypothetical protein